MSSESLQLLLRSMYAPPSSPGWKYKTKCTVERRQSPEFTYRRIGTSSQVEPAEVGDTCWKTADGSKVNTS